VTLLEGHSFRLTSGEFVKILEIKDGNTENPYAWIKREDGSVVAASMDWLTK